MKYISLIIFPILFLSFSFDQKEETILSYTVDPKTQNIQLYWKNDTGGILKSIKNLKAYVENKKSNLVFAMNGGMYTEDNSPLGLFIQDSKVINKINISSGKGNFHMKPNGVFFVTEDGKAGIYTTDDYIVSKRKHVKYATQSGPMLVINGVIHPEFKEGSQNLNIRNGVGILPDGKIIFAMSKNVINFYDFAKYFKDLGCKNALYLDGFVSRTYLPEKDWQQLDGNFGVMIGVTKPKAK